MRRLPLAMLWAWALAAGASACGTSDDDASVADPLTDAATDAPSLDGSPLDAAADASDAEPVDASEHDAPEDQMSPDADPDADADADAEPVFAHCPVLANPPGWVDRTVEGYAAVVRTAAVDIYLDAFDDGIVRVHQSAPGQAPSARSWAVETMPARDPQVVLGADNDDFVLCTRWMMLRIAPDGRIVAQDATGQPIMTDLAGPGLEEGHESVDGESVRTVKVVRALGSTQQLYGFGEHTGPLNKRGQRMTFWNTDAYDSNYGGYGPTADPLYQSVPFFISLTEGIASGVFTDNPFRLVMDMGATDPGRYEIKAYGGTIDQYLIAGPRMSEVVRRYALLTGTAPLPPRWALGFHQSKWGYSPDSAFEAIGAEYRNRRIPADALWLDIQHHNGFRTFTWDPVAFPDPAGMIARLASQGFKVIVIADPGIKQDPNWDVYLGGLAGNHFLKQPNGQLYVGPSWPGLAAFPDFSRAQTRQWWGAHVASLLNLGVRGIWQDLNEPTIIPEGGGSGVPNHLPAHGDGQPTTMAEVHNVYALLQARGTYEAMRQAASGRRPFILTRAGYAGIQRYAATWTGDAPSTWPTLRQTLPMLLNMGLSGNPFVGSDVGGYSGHATSELFARWIQLGSVSPFFRAHVTNGVPSQEPWQFGIEVEDISRSTVQQRYELLAYLYSLMEHSARTGEPVLRAMVYEFQHDASTVNLEDQAMLGPSVLVAPVLTEGATSRSIYIPEGRWFEYHSGAIVQGPATIEADVRLASLPMYVREGALVPRIEPMQYSDEKQPAKLQLDLYPAAHETSFDLYEDAGDGFGYESGQYSRVKYSLQQTDTGARLLIGARQGSWVPAPRALTIRVRRVDHGANQVRVDGQPIAQHSTLEALEAAAQGWWYDERDLSLVIAMPDRDNATVEMDYDASVSEPAPAVRVSLEVTVPQGTPSTSTIHVATSAGNWQHQPLQWIEPGAKARGEVLVPRGRWFEYKYTRGSWETVEKWPQCQEASNRYGFASAWPVRLDTVWQWADWCTKR